MTTPPEIEIPFPPKAFSLDLDKLTQNNVIWATVKHKPQTRNLKPKQPRPRPISD